MWIARKTGVRCIIPAITFFFGYFLHFSIHSTENSSLSEKSSPTINLPPRFLVILVLSSVNNQERRNTIRNTWARNLDYDINVYFVISGGSFTSEQRSSINDENDRYQDLLILQGVEESFHTLTKKVLVSFTWLTGDNLKWGPDGNTTISKQFSSFSYAMKTDDDSYVRIREIVTALRTTHTSKMLYWGFFQSAKVKKSGKYKEMSWNICDTYLPYALGGGYVLASAPIYFIAKNAKEWRQYQSEDTSVGAWLANLEGIDRVHDPRFDTEYLSRGCHQSYLVTHKHSVQAMNKMHEQLLQNGQLCAKEYRTRLSYRYDWNSLPSKCCARNNPNIP